MYLQQSNSKKKNFAPISAKRQKKRKIKRLFILLILIIFLLLLGLCIKKSFDYVFEHKSQWFNWKAKELAIQAQDDYTKKQIEKLIDFKKESIISSEEIKNIQNTLKTRLPQVEDIKISRGFISKKLTVKAKNYDILAKFYNGGTEYLLSSNGFLYNYDKAQIPSDILQVKSEDKIGGSFLPQELVKLLKDISKSPLTELAFIQVNLQENTFTLYLKDGSRVDMGLFDLYNDKIGILKDIIDISNKKRFKKPWQINFKYFKEGKIYLNTQV